MSVRLCVHQRTNIKKQSHVEKMNLQMNLLNSIHICMTCDMMGHVNKAQKVIGGRYNLFVAVVRF